MLQLLRYFLIINILSYTQALFAQKNIQGTIRDTRQQPINNAIVTLLKENKILSFTQSDGQGKFKISLKENENSDLQLKISKLGYAVQVVPIVPQQVQYLVQMHEQAVLLKEVQVKSVVSKHGDTVRYSVKNFQNAQDRNIGDILKKLPGVEVQPNGVVLYNGKAINNFYIENLNLLKEKYGMAVENISPKDVETVEVLENHQWIKALKNKDFTDRAAINLKLKEEAKGKWIGSGNIASGVRPFLAQTDVSVMNFKSGSQNLHTFKANNTGVDLLKEQQVFNLEDLTNGIEIYTTPTHLLGTPTFNPPLEKERYLFNKTATMALNSLKTIRPDNELKFNTSATYDIQQFRQSQYTQFILDNNNLLFLGESSENIMQTAKADISAEWTKNSPKNFYNNRIQGFASWQKNAVEIRGTLPNKQQATLPLWQIVNQGRWVFNSKKHAFKINNYQHFYFQPQDLIIQFDTLSQNSVQQLNRWNFHSHTNASFNFVIKPFSVEQKIGYIYEWDRMQSALLDFPEISNTNHVFDLQTTKLYNEINIGLKKETWRLNLYSPIYWLHYKGHAQNQNLWIINPDIRFNYNFATFFSTSIDAKYNHLLPNFAQWYPGVFASDYRTLQKGLNQWAVSKSAIISWLFRYNNPLQFTSAYLSANYQPIIHPYAKLLQYNGVFNTQDWFWIDNQMANTTIRLNSNQSFIDQGITIRLNINQFYINSNFIQQNDLQKFKLSSTQLNPEMRWQYAQKITLEYMGKIQRNQQKLNQESTSIPLWQQQHTFKIGYIPSEKYNFSLATEYYQNQIQQNQYATAFFLNAEARYVTKNKWQCSLIVRNITNQSEFEQQLFSNNLIRQNTYTLRSINILGALYYKF